jgi:hypothetical protein
MQQIEQIAKSRGALQAQSSSSFWFFLPRSQFQPGLNRLRDPYSPTLRPTLAKPTYFAFPFQKLKEVVPALKGLKYDESQERLPSILAGVAQTIANVLPRLPNLVSREEVMRLQELRGSYGIKSPAPICAEPGETGFIASASAAGDDATCQVVQAPSGDGVRLVADRLSRAVKWNDDGEIRLTTREL